MARTRPGGCSLGVRDVEVWWQGYSGLSLCQVVKKLKLLKVVGDRPHIIMLHCGGNDFGKTAVKKLRECLDEIVRYVHDNFDVQIIWSEVLPRTRWRHSDNLKAMESVRRRFNNYAANRIVA